MHTNELLLDDGPSAALLIGATSAVIAILTLAVLLVMDTADYVVTTWCH